MVIPEIAESSRNLCQCLSHSQGNTLTSPLDHRTRQNLVDAAPMVVEVKEQIDLQMCESLAHL